LSANQGAISSSADLGGVELFDSHAHVVADDSQRYPLAPLGGVPGPADLASPMTAERLLAELEGTPVTRAVLVQRASLYGFDNRYVCESAEKYPGRFSAVAAIDARAEDAASQVHRWVRESGAVGIRLMEPRRDADLKWLTSPPVWDAATELDVPVCVHFFRFNRLAGLAALERLLRSRPQVRVVVDHLSNLPAESGPPDYGLDPRLLALVKYPRVTLKFTTIPLGALEEQKLDTSAVLERVAREFGTERLMWGSDVTQSKGSYAYMIGLAARATAGLSSAQRRQVLCGTAQAMYGGG
jgi:L-fuconolactonase